MSRYFILLVVGVATLLMGVANVAQATPVSEETVAQLVQGWISSSSKPLGTEIDRIEAVTDSEKQVSYYVVYLKPHGYVVVAADDTIEPIICFSPGSQFDATGPLGVMLGKDLRTRQDIVDSITAILDKQASERTLQTSSSDLTDLEAVLTDAQSKWSDLLEKAPNATLNVQSSTSDRRKVVINEDAVIADDSTGYAPGGFDVWIDPLVRSAWNQSKILNYSWAANLYNISTPSNRPAGCTAVAMAQVMRYHTYPAGVTLGAASDNYELNNSGDPSDTNTISANFIGSYTNLTGVLSITNMPLDPAASFTPTGPATVQWSNIAALVFDAGLAVNTAYGTNQSGATFSKVVPALTNVFRYANAVYASTSNNYLAIINWNIMGSKPVIMAISSAGVTNSGHVVIADGFAFSAQGTLFHHINMGWGELGENTAWYNLPAIIAYNTIAGFAYNIFPTNTGELIVGRVTNTLGGVSGVSVTAGGITTTTDSRGFFSVIVTANTTNDVTTSKQGYLASTVSNVVVGTSSGNTQGNAFTYVNVVQGAALTLTAGTYSTNVLLEWTNPTNSSYTGLAHILWTTNASPGWDTWSAPTGAIVMGAATNKYPTNNVVSGGSLGGAENSIYYIHTNRTLGVTYYYKLWITNSSGWLAPDTAGSVVTAQAKPDTGTLTMYFQDNSSARLVRCLKFTTNGEVKLNTTVATTNMVPYYIASVGDFDSDNVDDILFQRNSGTNGAPNEGSALNSWYVWFMQSCGKLKSQTAMNVNDLTFGGNVVVRGVANQGATNALIVTRNSAGYMRIFAATNGVISATTTNYAGSTLLTNAVGWQSSMGITIR